MSEQRRFEPLPPRLEERSKMESLANIHKKMELDITERIGYDNLLKVPINRPAVIATDHLSDITLETVIAEASPFRQIGVAAQSTHLDIPLVGKFYDWISEGKIYPVSTVEETKHQRQALHIYKVEDYERMAESMKAGETVVTAAHRPTYKGKLPSHAGLSALTLAHLTESPIIPATVDIQASPEILGTLVKDVKGTISRLVTNSRPEATVQFGEPIHFDPISKEDLQLIERWVNISLRKTLSDDEKSRANEMYQKLTDQGDVLMEAIASQLSPEKRGRWGEAK